MRWTPIAGLAAVCCMGCTTFGGRFVAQTPRVEFTAEIDMPTPEDPTVLSEPPAPTVEPKPDSADKADRVSAAKIPDAERIAQEEALRAARFARGSEFGDKPAEFARDAKDYHWVQGRVSRIHVGREKLWKIRFADYHERDPHGGSFLLAGDLPANLAEGDLVRVEGVIPTLQGDGRNTHYRVHRLTILSSKAKHE